MKLTRNPFNLIGLSIFIEHPAGSIRSGIDKQGVEWSTTMTHHYGYIENTEGADGEEVDVFVKKDVSPNFNGKIFVVEQVNEDGTFDEHKVVLGADDANDAKLIYLSNYKSGWTGLGKLIEYSIPKFKTGFLSEWVTATIASLVATKEIASVSVSKYALKRIDEIGLTEKQLIECLRYVGYPEVDHEPLGIIEGLESLRALGYNTRQCVQLFKDCVDLNPKCTTSIIYADGSMPKLLKSSVKKTGSTVASQSEIAATKVSPERFTWIRYKGTKAVVLSHTKRNGEVIKTRLNPNDVLGYRAVKQRSTGKELVQIVLKSDKMDLTYNLLVKSFNTRILKVSKPSVMPKVFRNLIDPKTIDKKAKPDSNPKVLNAKPKFWMTENKTFFDEKPLNGLNGLAVSKSIGDALRCVDAQLIIKKGKTLPEVYLVAYGKNLAREYPKMSELQNLLGSSEQGGLYNSVISTANNAVREYLQSRYGLNDVFFPDRFAKPKIVKSLANPKFEYLEIPIGHIDLANDSAEGGDDTAVNITVEQAEEVVAEIFARYKSSRKYLTSYKNGKYGAKSKSFTLVIKENDKPKYLTSILDEVDASFARTYGSKPTQVNKVLDRDDGTYKTWIVQYQIGSVKFFARYRLVYLPSVKPQLVGVEYVFNIKYTKHLFTQY